MARKARKLQDCNLFSVTQTSGPILFRDATDRDMFLSILRQAKTQFGFELFAYCLLDDHRFRLLIDTHGKNISSILQSISVAYTNYRKADERLFPRRFKSVPLRCIEDVQEEIDSINTESQNPFNSYCLYCEDAVFHPDFALKFTQDRFEIQKRMDPINDEEALKLLEEWICQTGCDQEKIKKDKTLRNQCIAEFRKKTDLSLKQLGRLFDVTESTVSKILKEHEHSS
ncbi:MAG TPA: hypothetical protein DCQ90_07515 [Erysipelotrichaceae bacterium]|nr:hypothetical protein [Erysipelotrichaceae bacterium]